METSGLVRTAKYTRSDLKELAGLSRSAKGGPWDTGVVEHNGHFLIFVNIGTGGRTGHNYDNRWDGGLLRWYHKEGSRLHWPSVQRMLNTGSSIHILWRQSNEAPFEYAGRAVAVDVKDALPVEVLWAFVTAESDGAIFQTSEREQVKAFYEGELRQELLNVYERDRGGRQACIDFYGTACTVCGLAFEERYGDIGAGFIHVHHLVPLSKIGIAYQLDPVNDLRPVCPNCHAMIHRKDPALTILDVRKMLR